MDFFDFDGFSTDDFFNLNQNKAVPEKKTMKSSKKEKAEKKDTKKTSGKGKAAFNCEVSLPVTVLARNFAVKIGESGTMKLSEVCDELVKMGYEQMKIKNMGLIYLKETNVAYVTDNGIFGTSGNTQVFEETDSVITVVDGLLKCELSAENFADKDFDEITVDDVVSKWTDINMQYKGCGLYLDEQGLAYPVLIRDSSKITDDSMTVHVNGSEIEVETVGISDMSGLATKLAGEMGTAKPIIVKTDNAYFLSYEEGKEKPYCLNQTVAVKTHKQVEKKYPLPLTLYVVTWNMSYELTKEMFGGKGRVSKEEITEVMAKSEKMFADQERKVDYLYNEDRNLMSCMFISGKKGALPVCEEEYESSAHTGFVKMIRSLEELEACKKMDMFVGVCHELADAFILKALPHGNFYGYFGKELECCTVKRVDWQRKLPKIGSCVLKKIVDYFRMDLSHEAAVRILYNRRTGEFFTVAADGKKEKAMIEYDFTTAEPLMCMPGVIQVCEIHSHNTMPAFFSDTDDSDEQYTGIFGVIGSLDQELPTMKFRVGMDGVFKEIAVSDLFEQN